MDIHGFRQYNSNTLLRIFKMSFVPAGFWERFIARMLISLTEMDLQVPNQLTMPQILTIHPLNWHVYCILHSRAEMLFLCSYLNQKKPSGASTAGILWSTALLEVKQGIAAAPLESDAVKPFTGRRGCWSHLMEVTSGQSLSNNDMVVTVNKLSVVEFQLNSKEGVSIVAD